MKGVVFTEFVEFVESSFGFDAVDKMIEDSGLSGVYTQAGNYPFDEMVALIVALSKAQNVEVNTLLEGYGVHLFGRLAGIYPNINKFSSAFDLISHVDNIIHPEVHKLYPDAELPSFKVVEFNANKLTMEYQSDKPLQHLAKGLMIGAGKHYKEDLEVTIYEETKPVLLEVLKK
jgi:hypothetical protein